MFLAGLVLAGAGEDASRMIKTGRAQSYEVDDFRALMCEYTFRLFGSECSGVRVIVNVIDDFTSTTTATMPTTTCEEDEGGKTVCDLDIEEEYLPGAGGEVVQVTAYYRWPLVISLPYFNLANQPDNARLLAATRVFKNEPF